MNPFRETKVGHPAALLQFLQEHWSDLRRKTLQEWLRHRRVTVNGELVTRYNHPLRVGDTVAIGREAATPGRARLGSGLRICLEDEHLIVIDKPAGLLSMASERERDRTAFAQLMNHVRRGNPRSRARVFIVHRLDKETSGLMVFARTESAKQTLQEGWQQVTKRYLAIVEGRLPCAAGRIESHLDESDPFRVRSLERASAGTRPATTEYRVLREGSRSSLVALTLVTGRRHQIRAHLAGLGCPIQGDPRYGAATNPARRLALHAAELVIPHPVDGRILRFESPLPSELAACVEGETPADR